MAETTDTPKRIAKAPRLVRASWAAVDIKRLLGASAPRCNSAVRKAWEPWIKH
jgi:hypothetical protein